jgi:sirohydrochlorin cobaltochelatase
LSQRFLHEILNPSLKKERNIKRVIVLIMHGMTPKDYPSKDKQEYMSLRSRQHSHSFSWAPQDRLKHQEMEQKIRRWPRTKANDPFHSAALRIARDLQRVSKLKVFVGFNEFCAPSADEALELAVQSGAQEVIVTTPMLTPGGHHSEEEIPEIISGMRARYPKTQFIYSWPFKEAAIAKFLHQNIKGFLNL